MAKLLGIRSSTDISSHDLIWPLLLFFGMEICINTSVFGMFSKTALLQATNEFLILGVVVEFKSFGFSCVVVGQQYSLNFILVSYFHFEMFGIMAEIFLLAGFFVRPYLAYLNSEIRLSC